MTADVGSGPRLPLLPVDSAREAAAGVGVPDALAELNVFRVLLHHPPLAKWLSDLLMGLLGRGRLDTRLRELMIMRVGWVTGSDYEWAQHWRIALTLGLSDSDLVGVRDWERYSGFGPAERAVLAAVDETLADGRVGESTWRTCRDHVSSDPAVLLEVLSVVGVWRMVAAQLLTLGVPLEEGVESWPPDGRGPADG